MVNPEYDVAYFKDDHNRIVRVAIHRRTGEIELHVVDKLDDGEQVWVPLPAVDGLSVPLIEIEAPCSYEDLVKQASTCSLFNKN